jgi:hypothetical protein
LQELSRKLTTFTIAVLAVTVLASSAQALDIRYSVKVFTDTQGNSHWGANHEDGEAQVRAAFELANKKLIANRSELRMLLVEIVYLRDSAYTGAAGQHHTYPKEAIVPNQSYFFNINNWGATWVPGTSEWHHLKGLADPARAGGAGSYAWRNDAMNVYINRQNNGGCDESDFLFVGSDGRALLHESGHALNLRHTHERPGQDGDGCTDTVKDYYTSNPFYLWSIDQVAFHNYHSEPNNVADTAALGASDLPRYANLTDSQRAAVDRTYYNPMRGTHDPYPAFDTWSEGQFEYITTCQRNRMTRQAYTVHTTTVSAPGSVGNTEADKDRGGQPYLTRNPVYAHSAYAEPRSGALGAPTNPHSTLVAALSDSKITQGNGEIVLERGTYIRQGSLTSQVVITSRNGSAYIVPK